MTGRSDQPRVVAVIGSTGVAGAAICRELLATESIRQVVALGTVRPPVPGVTLRRVDVTDASLAAALRGVHALVYAPNEVDDAADRAARRKANELGVSVALMAAAAAGVRQVVLISSARVYGAAPDNPVPLPEDAPLQATAEGDVADLLALERIARSLDHAYPQTEVCVLRPAWLLAPGLPNPAGGLLDGPRLLVVRGTKPHWQFCHVDDLAAAVCTAVTTRMVGAATVASEGWIEQADVQKVLKRRPLELPATIAFETAARLHAIGVTSSPSELAYLVYPWVVGSERLREAGWKPAYSNLEALTDYADGRPARAYRLPVDPKGAATATAAAGATVALIGTAALVRRARKRRASGK
ncbi:NAD-dependent epimerase/dehydratase family protein [Fodinicola acaciae]|uniref:NAD-dependent epimerase/dehydratase family protein n=1 Tax=Fodinicola acaciae TaxID=2681555 RepID=UPI0013D1B3C5|nr:NAD-dependent epimerase/dehydratase family protein [Fodinicola acaciae]